MSSLRGGGWSGRLRRAIGSGPWREAARPFRRPIGLERLEDRRLLSITSWIDRSGLLTVRSDASDAITIEGNSGWVRINGVDPLSGPAACSNITGIEITGGPGANAIDL